MIKFLEVFSGLLVSTLFFVIVISLVFIMVNTIIAVVCVVFGLFVIVASILIIITGLVNMYKFIKEYLEDKVG